MWLAFTMAVFFFSIICTFIKLIFVIFASVEISVRDKMGCWNEVIMKNFAWNEVIMKNYDRSMQENGIIEMVSLVSHHH